MLGRIVKKAENAFIPSNRQLSKSLDSAKSQVPLPPNKTKKSPRLSSATDSETKIQKQSKIVEIPELLLLIFEHLDVVSLLKTIARVNKAFYQCALQSIVDRFSRSLDVSGQFHFVSKKPYVISDYYAHAVSEEEEDVGSSSGGSEDEDDQFEPNANSRTFNHLVRFFYTTREVKLKFSRAAIIYDRTASTGNARPIVLIKLVPHFRSTHDRANARKMSRKLSRRGSSIFSSPGLMKNVPLSRDEDGDFINAKVREVYLMTHSGHAIHRSRGMIHSDGCDRVDGDFHTTGDFLFNYKQIGTGNVQTVAGKENSETVEPCSHYVMSEIWMFMEDLNRDLLDQVDQDMLKENAVSHENNSYSLSRRQRIWKEAAKTISVQNFEHNCRNLPAIFATR